MEERRVRDQEPSFTKSVIIKEVPGDWSPCASATPPGAS
jgi:hypothetical protein